MKSRLALALAVLATLASLPVALPVNAAESSAVQSKEGWYPNLVDEAFVRKYAVLPKPDGVMLIDSRPTARKYDPGHIPTAVNIPDTQFEKMTDKLPADKAAPLFFYCDGLNCKLSGNSAEKAIKLGYTKVMVVPEGWPAWEKAYGAAPAAGGAPAIEQGKESGTITVASFEKIMKDAPDSIALIDVRDPSEFATGTFKGAVNVPINTLEKNIDKLPKDKPIVFFCGAAGRGGEAHDMVKLLKPEMKTYFINANIKWNKDGSYTMAEIK